MSTDITQLDNLSLASALAASSDRRAVYEHDGTRVFISERDTNYDWGVRAPGVNDMKLDRSPASLDGMLASLGVSKDSGWRSA
jgi:hypothetical protein